MKFLMGGFLIIGSICGIALSFLGETVISSSLLMISGMDISIGIGIFSLALMLSGIYLICIPGNNC